MHFQCIVVEFIGFYWALINHDFREENWLLIEMYSGSSLIHKTMATRVRSLVAFYYLSGYVMILRFGKSGAFKTMR